MNNYERIKQMSLEEMAEFIIEQQIYATNTWVDSIPVLGEWLNAESEEQMSNKIYDVVPVGFYLLEGATTAPKGYNVVLE